MGYMTKAKAKLISQLALSVKVAGKRTAEERITNGTTDAWHTFWDECEYSHMALEVLLGVRNVSELQAVAQYNTVARNALSRIEGHIGT
jgi:hypothetical protein